MLNTTEVQIEGNVLEIKVTGKLTKEFYEEFVPVVDNMFEQNEKIRILCQMHDFHGWTMGALWEDLKFDLRHWKDIERLALVGESKWQQGMAAFCKPFTTAKIQYFNHDDLAKAYDWVRAED